MAESSAERSLRIGPATFHIRASEAPECLTDLEVDFGAFQNHFPGPAGGAWATSLEESIELRLRSATSKKSPLFGFRFAEGRFVGPGSRRQVHYTDGAEIRSDRGRRETVITARSVPRLYELTYLFMLSRLGEALDRAGVHRVHGLGMHLKNAEASWLLVMDSGVGKSRLALALAGKAEFYSDETPLLNSAGKMLPFPIRLAIAASLLRRAGFEPDGRRRMTRLRYGTKCLVPLEDLGPIATASAPKLIGWVTRSTDGSPHWRPAHRLEILWALFRCCVVGVGVAQMAEHFLRFDPMGLGGLIRIALSRWQVIRTTLAGAKHTLALEFCDDAKSNLHMIEEIQAHYARSR